MRAVRYYVLVLLLTPLSVMGAEHKTYTFDSRDFTFKLFVTRNIFSDKYEYICGIDSIMVHYKSTGAYQTIYCETNGYNCRDTTLPIFYIEDVNFDGIDDLRIMKYRPEGPDIPYYYWLYDTAKKRFEQNRALEEISSPQIDHKTKTIKNEWRATANKYGSSTYEYINGKLTKTEEITKEYDGQGFVNITVKKQVKNRLIVTAQTREKVD